MRYWFPIIALATFHESCADKAANMERIMETRECFAVVEDIQYADGTGENKLDCELEDGEMIPVSGIDESWITENLENEILHSGLDSIELPPGSEMRNGEVIVPSGKNVTVHQNTRFRRLSGVTGTKTVLVARIEGLDSGTTGTEKDISNKVFGTDGDVLNLRSGYLACSHEKLDFQPMAIDNDLIMQIGVTTVKINENVKGASKSTIQNAAVKALDTKFGAQSTQNIADYIILCIPPGTGDWLAYAYINHYLSVYNDDWCKSPSALMHEVGHNLNLAHSGESATYDDQSGLMGYSYSDDEGPAMCFNGPKNWQLGWFDDKRIELTPKEGTKYSFILIGAADYKEASENEYVILKVGDKCYISFNRNTGINSGTQEGANQVLVHKKEGTGYGLSYLLSKLSSGGSYNTDICDGSGEELKITVDSIGTRAQVTLCLGGYCAPAASPTKVPTKVLTKAPINAPTKSPTKSPTRAPLPSVSRPPVTSHVDCVELEISVQPDDWPGDITWTLVNECSDEVVFEQEAYSFWDTGLKVKTLCVPDVKYKFEIKDSYGDGICCNTGIGYYKGVFGGVQKFYGGSFGRSMSHEFGVCSTCKTLEISVKLDFWSEDTSWTLVNECTGEKVADKAYSFWDTGLQVETLCVSDGKYKFEIKDSFGDGISGGGGYYKGVFDGVDVFDGGSFGFSMSHEFGSCNLWSYFENW